MPPLHEFFPSLGFLGAGNMATAILRGTVSRGLLLPQSVAICDVLSEKTDSLRKELGVRVASDARQLAETVEAIVLAIKPQGMMQALASLGEVISERHLVVSIAAGVPSRKIAASLDDRPRIVRVMPNTPALIGCGAAGVAAGPNATERDVLATLELFRAVGEAVVVAEGELDAVTALSGSGPAYVFRVIEILREAGEELGLDAATAHALTVQTVLGAARLAAESGEDPAVLRQRVTSPGGTTEAALRVFAERGLDDVLKAGVRRACERSAELAALQ